MKKLVLAAMILGPAAVGPSLARAAIVPEYYTVTLEFTSTTGEKQKADLKCHRGKTCRETVKLSIDGKQQVLEFFSTAIDDEALEVRLGSPAISGGVIDTVGAYEPYESGKSWQRPVVKTTRRITATKLDSSASEKGVVRFTLK